MQVPTYLYTPFFEYCSLENVHHKLKTDAKTQVPAAATISRETFLWQRKQVDNE
jgi:hypothetical protein